MNRNRHRRRGRGRRRQQPAHGRPGQARCAHRRAAAAALGRASHRGSSGGRRHHHRDLGRARRRGSRQRLAGVVPRHGRRRGPAPPGLGGRRRPRHERRHRARPRRGTAVRLAGRSSAASSRAPSDTAPPSRCCRSWTPSSASRANASRASQSGQGVFRAQTPQGARRDLLVAAAEAHAGGPEVLADEAELLARGRHPRPRRGGRGHEHQGDAARGPRPGAAPGGAAVPRPAGAGLGQPPLRSRRRAAPGRTRSSKARPACTATPTATSSSTRSATACWRRPAAATWDGSSRPASATTRGVDSRALVAEVMAPLERAELAVDSVDVTISGARPRLGGQRLDAMAASIARAHRGCRRACLGQGRDRQPARATTAPGGPSVPPAS